MGQDGMNMAGTPFIALQAVAAGAALACLEGRPLAARFSAWRGASGRRYICTVYPAERSADRGLPPYDGMIVLAVRRDAAGVPRVLAVGAVGDDGLPDDVLDAAADEWHVHLMAEAPAQRTAALRDLLAR